MSSKPVDEPYWAPLPRPHFTPMQTAGIVARHLIPIVGVLFFGWSASQFVLLSVFNIAFTVTSIGALGSAVSQRKGAGPSTDLMHGIGSLISLLLAALLATLLLTAMFGWAVALFVKWNASIIWAALMMVLSAAPALLQQYRMDVLSPMTAQERTQRDQPNVVVLILSGGVIFMLSGYIADFGRFGLAALAIAVSALLVFRELRPEMMRELTRPKNMPPPKEYGEAGKKET